MAFGMALKQIELFQRSGGVLNLVWHSTVRPYQDISTRMYPQTSCRSFQLNLETVYALVVLFIYWEDNIWKVLLKIYSKMD